MCTVQEFANGCADREDSEEPDEPPIADAITAWHDKLRPCSLLAMAQSFRELQALETIKIGTGFGGSDIVIHVLNLLLQRWERKLELKLRVEHSFAVERETSKQ